MSNSRITRSLQRKVSVRLALAMVAFIAVVYIVLRAVVTPAFEELELRASHADLVRAEQSIQTEIDNLERVSYDWSSWDDTYNYATGNYPGFQKSNLERSTLANLGLDLLAIFDANGDMLWGQLQVGGTERPIEGLGLFMAGNAAAKALTKHGSRDSAKAGLVDTALGPLIASSQPILRNDDSGPVAGALIMAQFLDATRLTRLRKRTEVDMSWQLVADATDTVVEAGELPIRVTADHVINHRVIPDLLGAPHLLITTRTPRDISWLGQQSVGAAIAFVAAAGVLLVTVLWWFMKGTIIQPIEALTSHMDKVRETGDLSDKLDLQSDDEIGVLANRYNALNTEVLETRAALLHQSFKAGKADTAAEVLHNIRNAMTPMINGLDRLAKVFRVADGLHVKKAVEELANPECDPLKSGKYLQYLGVSFDRIATVLAEASEDLKVVTSQARQVEGILKDQEKFTKAAPVAENLVIDEIVEEAIHVIPTDSKLTVDVSADASLHRFRVRAHRVGLLQVLGNLMLNAHESIQRANRSEGRIEVSAIETTVDEKDMVQLTVRDNGTGFPEHVRNKIFQRGYTSKDRGQTNGLGLHWCANALASMGGRILADSPGEGQGAEFHVLLPSAQGV